MKLAAVKTEAKPHQQRIADRIAGQPGLVVAHEMGSGKTLASLMGAENFGGETDVVVPASLRTNYEKEIAKHVDNPKAKYHISSIQEIARNKRAPERPFLIVDEAHRLRGADTAGHQAIAKNKAEKRLFLTGSPLYNQPADLASLVNLASGERLLPTAPADFDKQYVETTYHSPGLLGRLRGAQPGETKKLKNTGKLKEILDQWVDYHPNTKEDFPARTDVVVNAPLEGRQLETYQAVLGRAPAWAQHKIKNNLPLSKQEAKELNSFLSGTRQVATSLGGHAEDLSKEEVSAESAKVQAALQRLQAGIAQNPGHKALIYSNFLDAGLHPYETALQGAGIPYGSFTGEMTKSDRDRVVEDYNRGAIKALLLSSAGGEGLDLKGTRQIQVLEPHFNKEKLEQVIARGIRFKSHEALTPEERNVSVEHYIATLPEPGRIAKVFGKKRETSVDEYLRTLSADKDALNQQIKDLMVRG